MWTRKVSNCSNFKFHGLTPSKKQKNGYFSTTTVHIRAHFYIIPYKMIKNDLKTPLKHEWPPSWCDIMPWCTQKPPPLTLPPINIKSTWSIGMHVLFLGLRKTSILFFKSTFKRSCSAQTTLNPSGCFDRGLITMSTLPVETWLVARGQTVDDIFHMASDIRYPDRCFSQTDSLVRAIKVLNQ